MSLSGTADRRARPSPGSLERWCLPWVLICMAGRGLMGKGRGGDRLEPRQLHVFPPRNLGCHHRLGVRDGAVTMARLALSPVPSNWLVVLLLLLPGTAI